MKEIWKSIADILKGVNNPFNLIGFLVICIIIVAFYRKSLGRIHSGKITKFLSIVIILFFFATLGFDYFKTKKSEKTNDEEYILQEEFDNNNNNWNVGNRARLSASINNGYFNINSNSNAWYPISIPISSLDKESKNSEISFKFKVKCIDNTGYGGIDWGMDNEQNRICLYINNKKEWYLAIKSRGNVIAPLLEWKSNMNIKNNDFNHISIKNSSDKSKIYFNDAFITDLPHIDFQGNRIGFSVINAELYVDYLRIKKL